MNDDPARLVDLELPLFDDPTAAHDGKVGRGHPDTSRQAAREVRWRAGTQCDRLARALVARGETGLTNAEGAHAISVVRNQTATRMGELVEAGWAEKLVIAGKVVTRPTDADGRFHGEVYVATPRARFLIVNP